MSPLPRFATNQPENGETVAGAIKELFSAMRQALKDPPSLSIATAYINPGGFSLLADELNQAPRIRLLLGAEPDPAVTRSIEAHHPDAPAVLQAALESHAGWLSASSDAMGFTKDSVETAKLMVVWLESTTDDGSARVEVRRYAHGFLHGKAFIAEGALNPEMLAGSSNMTYAGLAKNAELNLAGDHDQVARSLEWFEHYWEQSSEYDLAALYKAQWAPYTPWQVFVRMLFELYGHTLADDKSFQSSLFELTSFQQDGVIRMKRLLKSLNGVLVADEVGLGKSFMAGELIREATEELKQHVLILSPASIKTVEEGLMGGQHRLQSFHQSARAGFKSLEQSGSQQAGVPHLECLEDLVFTITTGEVSSENQLVGVVLDVVVPRLSFIIRDMKRFNDRVN